MNDESYFKNIYSWLVDPCWLCEYWSGFCALPNGVECPDIEAETGDYFKLS